MKQVWIAALAGALLLAGCNSGSSSTASSDTATTTGTTGTSGSTGTKPAGGEKTIAFVTNGISDFWTIAKKGADKAQGEIASKGFKVEFVEPQDNAAAQKAKLDDLVTNGVKGIALSPLDPANQTDYFNSIAAKTTFITTDSDAPASNRICYIGTSNIDAGKKAGETIKKALPAGGKIAVFVGKIDVLNAKERFEGIQDALKGSNIVVLPVKTDDADRARAKQNVSDAMVANPDLACCVGLWSYNGPAIVAAVKEAHKEGKVKIVCFDEEDGTLAGIRDGSVFGTIVQNPFEFGYQTMIMLSKLIDGEKPTIPDNKLIIIPVRLIDKSNVEPFATDLKKLRGK